jgi:acetyltransferase-like isoleucine patch superfamily enzyme
MTPEGTFVNERRRAPPGGLSHAPLPAPRLEIEAGDDRPATGERSVAATAGRVLREMFAVPHYLGFRRLAWSVVNACPPFTLRTVRTRMLAWAGSDLSAHVGVLGPITLIGPRGCAKRLRIGSGTLITQGAVFGLDATISIGKNVCIGPYAILHTGTHAIGPSSCRMDRGAVIPKRIVVEDGVWIGMGAMILPGVRLGRGSVVSAGAVVREDVAADTIVAGNPACAVRVLPNDR